MAPVLQISNLAVSYPGPVQAVRAVTLSVGAGQMVALVGESGSGKTTIARAVLGLLPSGTKVAGSIMLTGIDIRQLSARQLRDVRGRLVGYVPQDPHAGCDPLRRVRHHVREAWSAKRRRTPPGLVGRLLAEVGIDDPDHRSRQYPHQWSGGMLQRATIAAATAHHPPITIADEPTSALDADRTEEIITVLRGSSDALLLITHDLELVAAHADLVHICLDGEIVESGAPREILARPRHEYTRRLLAARPRPRIGNKLDERHPGR